MLPLLLLPVLVPLLSGAVRATSDVLLANEVGFEAIQLLLVSDAVYLIVSFLVFEYVLDE
jgi:ABC-type transport system involved in cytochrome c biogenesis permease component